MSPRGQEHGTSGGMDAANNEIYYPLGVPQRGTAVAWNWPSGTEGKTAGGIPKRIEQGRGGAWPVSTPSEGAEDREIGRMKARKLHLVSSVAF